MNIPCLETIAISVKGAVALIELNRPQKANALNAQMWLEFEKAFRWLDRESQLRVGILSARGEHFTSGIDLEFLMSISRQVETLSEVDKQAALRHEIVKLQDAVSAIEQCRKPVIAAIKGACIGAGVDIITACDIRYAAKNATFSVKEVDLAIVADLGTLQRLPRLINPGTTRELAYTGRQFKAVEALAMGLISDSYESSDPLMTTVHQLAQAIADKSPLTIQGIKQTLNYSSEHDIQAGLDYVAYKNAANLVSGDLEEAMAAYLQKRPAKY